MGGAWYDGGMDELLIEGGRVIDGSGAHGTGNWIGCAAVPIAPTRVPSSARAMALTAFWWSDQASKYPNAVKRFTTPSKASFPTGLRMSP